MEFLFRLVSMAENPEIQECVANIAALHSASKEVTDCMSGWLAFMQVRLVIYYPFMLQKIRQSFILLIVTNIMP